MKRTLAVTSFMLATLAWAAAQSGGAPGSGQTTPPSAQAPAQTQPSAPGSADQTPAQGSASNAPITEGCLGGSDPNYTITDKAGTPYKLNLPANSNAASLKSHVGESVQVQGDLKDAGKPTASIDVQKIGRGTGTCPASGSTNPPPPPKQ